MSTSTGGFVIRSERSPHDLKSATAQVGPGQYAVASPSHAAAPAAAPFHTSMERHLMENTTTSAVTPGVGAYDAAAALDAILCRHAEPVGSTAAFASTTSRLHVDKGKVANPGPGTYPEGNAWLRKSHHYSAPPARQRVNFVRVPSAPSIPAPHQSYGYEEGGRGELIMQKAQDPIYTGVGRDTVGPGSYDPEAGPKAAKAVMWGASKTKRNILPKKDVPGPGSYNLVKDTRPSNNAIVVSINGVDVQFGGASGSCQFVSKVPLASHRTVPDYERTPGPGAYNADLNINVDCRPPPPKEMQFFGSTARRACEVDPMKSLAAPTYFRNPGPGAYEDPRRSLNLKKGMSDPMPFASTSTRFGPSDNGIPGPGEYRPDLVRNILKEQLDKAAISKGGTFGTTSARFPDDPAAAKLPGPGNYDAKPVSSYKVESKSDGATFASKTERFKPAQPPPTAMEIVDEDGMEGPARGDPTRLGPGSYDQPDPWTKTGKKWGYKKAAFGSEAKRMSLAHPGAKQTPGPGRYNSALDLNSIFRPYTVPAKETVFGSQTNRFKGPVSYAPGPGHYNVGGDFVRKTFNITYAGVEVA